MPTPTRGLTGDIKSDGTKYKKWSFWFLDQKAKVWCPGIEHRTSAKAMMKGCNARHRIDGELPTLAP